MLDFNCHNITLNYQNKGIKNLRNPAVFFLSAQNYSHNNGSIFLFNNPTESSNLTSFTCKSFNYIKHHHGSPLFNASINLISLTCNESRICIDPKNGIQNTHECDSLS